MAAVTFRLRHNGLGKDKQPLTNPVAIQVTYYHEGISVELSTGIKVKPENWNGSRVTGDTSAKRINKVLAELETALFNVHIDHRNKSKAEHEAIVRSIIKGEEPVQKKTVETWMRDFVKQSKKKAGTAQVYNATVDHLEGYAKHKKISLAWESFDLDFYESFVDYLYGKDHNDNTVGKYIRKLKHLISEAFERNLHTNLSFKKKGFRAPSAEVDEIYLSEAEIIQFYNVDLPDLLESKMRFVFACWVGLRFGDLSKLNPNQFQTGVSGPILRVVTEKTGEEVIISLHPLAQEIWSYWQKNPPKKIDNPTFNEHIKTIAEKAGFDEPVQKRNTIKGKVSVQWVKKFEMVKAHTARRSFATNCYLMGMPSKTIMAVTGHRTEKAFLKYIRVTKDQHANIMADFFKRNSETPIMRKAN